MTESSRFSVLRASLLLLGIVACGVPLPARAHLDPPGPPTIFVVVEFNSGQLTKDQDDGGGDAELLFVFKIGNSAHGQQVSTLEADVDWDATAGAFSSSKRLYEHLECSPSEPLALNVKLVEVDTFGVPEAVAGIASVVAEIEESLSPLSLLFSLIGGLEYLNGDDDLGEATLVLDAGGASMELRGEDGGCDISVIRAELVRSSPPCESAGRAQPGKKAVAAFRRLGDAVAATAGFVPEPDNPAAPTPAALADLQACVAGLAADVANLAAAGTVDAARTLQGVDQAAAHYEQAMQERAGGDLEAAIREFGQADRAATLAIERGRPRGATLPPEDFPLDAVLAPQFVSTTPGRRLTIVGAVVGRQPGQDLVNAAVLGLPPGIAAPAFVDSPGTFRIEMDLASAPLGTFAGQVQLLVGSEILFEPLVVAVHQD